MSYFKFSTFLLLIFFLSELTLVAFFQFEDLLDVKSNVTSLARADSKPVINEFLPDPSKDNNEWVELYVPDGVDVTNYWIDDDTDFTNDSGSSEKKQIKTVVQGGDSHHVIFTLSSSMFNNSGDIVALFAPDGALIDQYTYGSDPGKDISVGRSPDGTGDFQILSSATKGSQNSLPKPSDTPIPAPTQKPTKEPKPTETPKPPKNTSIPTIVPNKSDVRVLADSTMVSNIQDSPILPTQMSSISAVPTSILIVPSSFSEKRFTPIKKQVLVKSANNTFLQTIVFSTGGVLLAGCGILMYLKQQHLWPWKKKND